MVFEVSALSGSIDLEFLAKRRIGNVHNTTARPCAAG
jgi:hypothetical protein